MQLFRFCFYLFLGSLCALSACKEKPKQAPPVVESVPMPTHEKLVSVVYGRFDSTDVMHYTLKNKNGMQAGISSYGATLTHLLVPDRNGKFGDVVLGFNSLEGYLQKGNPYMGATVGRYANRIAKASFTLNGKTYHLAKNNGENSLHGGIKSFGKLNWKTVSTSDSSIAFAYVSVAGEEGFPGNLATRVTYTLTSDNILKLDYAATTDAPTPVNLSNHSYFNLSAGTDSTILDHELTLNCSRYTPVNDKLIPLGKIDSVKGGPMDFTTAKKIGRDIEKVPGGYDHNFISNHPGDLIASVYHAGSGRLMSVYTSQPGVQFYTGNFLNGSPVDTKEGRKYIKHSGFCLETQHFPDSPNQPKFPSTILNPDVTYTQSTSYAFSIK
jgi:aldose 1-epimerase